MQQKESIRNIENLKLNLETPVKLSAGEQALLIQLLAI